ncbi:MAG: helix-turn-helix transcriptional regulator [Streptosporangiaceae bacterium]
MTADPPGTGSTTRRIMLGAQLRKLREGRNITRAEAGFSIRASESKISRLELGRVGFKERDVADLLTLYGVDDLAERTALLLLAEQANTPGWWHAFSEVLPSWFQTYVGLEEAASLIRTYELQFVPGLLQTTDYARAVIRAGNARAPDVEIDQRVGLRLRRQEKLLAADGPHVWAVVDEAVLRRPIGTPEAHRGQLEHLIALSKETPTVTLQVVPFSAGAHAAEGGAFSLLRFPQSDLPDIAYVETLTGGVYVEKREDVDTYLHAMERLCVVSATPDETVELIEDILRGI